MLDLEHPEVAFAVEAVRAASLMAKEIQANLVTPALLKGDKSPVTVADFAVQAVVGYYIDRAFAGDPLVGEEDGAALREEGAQETLDGVTKFVTAALPDLAADSVLACIDRGGGEPAARFWTLDPIDGTKGFLRQDQYAIALALIVDGEVQLGVLGCPNLSDGCVPNPGGPGSLVIAQRGQGTYTIPLMEEDEPLHLTVSEINTGADARVLRSFESGHTNVDQLDDVLAELQNAAEPVRMDSQAKYGVLAAGKGDLLFRLLSASRPDYRECIWDQAAGSIVVEEAGGRITDLNGKKLDFSAGKTLAKNRGVLASNGQLHDAALAALKSTGAA